MRFVLSTTLINDIDFSDRRRLHSTRRSGDGKMNGIVRTALRYLTLEAAVDYRRHLRSARQSTEKDVD